MKKTTLKSDFTIKVLILFDLITRTTQLQTLLRRHQKNIKPAEFNLCQLGSKQHTLVLLDQAQPCMTGLIQEFYYATAGRVNSVNPKSIAVVVLD
mgnify:CR=1 FL=1